MTRGLVRFQESGQTHFITFSAFHREPKLVRPDVCNLVLQALEQTRLRFQLRVYGYVLMPEHVHLLLSEPEQESLADALHFLKLSSSKQIHSITGEHGAFWQLRYYDRNIRSYNDFVEKLRYIHRNPVKRGLCVRPEDWEWSSFRHYATGEIRLIEIESEWTAKDRLSVHHELIPG